LILGELVTELFLDFLLGVVNAFFIGVILPLLFKLDFGEPCKSNEASDTPEDITL
jgi:hypothetical protein